MNNLKSVAIKCLEEIETNMAGVLCFTSMKIFLCKSVNVEGLPDDFN